MFLYVCKFVFIMFIWVKKKGTSMKRIKILVISIASFAIAIGATDRVAKAKQVRDIIDDYDQLVSEAYTLSTKYYEYSTFNLSYFEEQNGSNTKNTRIETQQNNYVFDNYFWKISVEKIYGDFSLEEKNAIEVIKYKTPDFSLAYSILIGNHKNEANEISSVLDSAIKGRENVRRNDEVENYCNNQVKFEVETKNLVMVIAGDTAIVFSTISSMVSGINAASLIPFVGWGIAIGLTAALIIYIAANWNSVKEGFDSFVESLKRKFQGISSLLSKASRKAKKKAKQKHKKERKEIPEEIEKERNKASNQITRMQEEIKREWAPKGIKSAHKPHDKKYGKPHVHFKDGTAINYDSTIRDRHNGIPTITRKILNWLHKFGFCKEGMKI